MLAIITQRLRASVRSIAQTAMLGTGAALLLLVGLVFMTLAAWLYLVTVTTEFSAALILGGGFIGMGFLLLAIVAMRSSGRSPREKSQPKLEPDTLTNIVMAFLAGMTAGQKTRR